MITDGGSRHLTILSRCAMTNARSLPQFLLIFVKLLGVVKWQNSSTVFVQSVFDTTESDLCGYSWEEPLGNKPSGMGEIVVFEEGIFSLLLDLDEKVVGPDNMKNIFLKLYADWVAKCLTVILSPFRPSIV